MELCRPTSGTPGSRERMKLAFPGLTAGPANLPANRRVLPSGSGELCSAGMKVATRITVATAVVVLIATTIYTAFDLRSRVAERRATLEHEAKGLAQTLRATFEVSASAFRPPRDAVLEIMSASSGGWLFSVFPRVCA